MLATTLGIEFDPNTAWDEREKIYKMSGKIVKTLNITQSAEGDKNGRWDYRCSSSNFYYHKAIMRKDKKGFNIFLYLRL